MESANKTFQLKTESMFEAKGKMEILNRVQTVDYIEWYMAKQQQCPGKTYLYR